MAFPINQDLQFNSGAQAVNFRLHVAGTAPSGTLYQGQLYYNSGDDKVYKRTASAWVDVTAGAGAINDVQGTLPIVSNVSSGVATISINAATTSAAGSMSSADKTKLDNATASNTNSTLVLRDGSGNFAANVITVNSITITNAPSAGTDGVNKTYVDGLIAGLKRNSVRGATTAILTASAQTSTTITIGGTSFVHDGITYANGETILVKDSVTGGSGGTFNNGAYSVGGVGSSIVLTRVTWMDAASEIDGTMVVIEDGTANVGKLFLTVSEVTTLGTDAITFTEINKATDLVAGNGLTLTGLTLAVVATDSSITVASDSVGVNVNTTGGLEISSGVRIKTDVTTANTIGVTVVANGAGVKFDANSFADSGSETLALAAGVAGAGLTLTTGVLAVASGNTGIAVNANDITLTLATNPGLEIVSGLKIKSDTVTANTIGVTLTTNGAGIKYNSASFTETSETLELASGVAGTGLDLTSGVLSVENYTPVASSTIGRVRVFAATSIGSNTPVQVTHNLNTQAVVVMVLDSTTKQAQLVDIVANGVNTVQVTALGTNYNADIIVIG